MIACLFAVSGAATGVAHAGLLMPTARGVPFPVPLLARLVLVGGVLFLAARAGHLAVAALGWLTGFAVAGVLVHRRFR